jgi:hypothetical protein
MARQLTAAPLAKRLQPWLGIWVAAVARPSAATFGALASRPDVRVSTGVGWIFMAGLVAGLFDTAAQLIEGTANIALVDTLLLATILLSALIAALYLVAFAGCALGATRLLGGTARYGPLAYTFASFSAPLLLIASVLAHLPGSRALLLALYAYWLALSVVALRASSRLSLRKALVATLGALLAVGAAWLGVAFLVGYSGILLP